MLRVNPVSLNAISYNAVITALEIIRDGSAPVYETTVTEGTHIYLKKYVYK
jgi:hypothetical protein